MTMTLLLIINDDDYFEFTNNADDGRSLSILHCVAARRRGTWRC